MNFTLEEKIEALTRIGYEIRKEEVLVEDRNELPSKHVLYNVYYHGQEMMNWATRHFGTYRVDWVFEEELKKKMLRLFRYGI